MSFSIRSGLITLASLNFETLAQFYRQFLSQEPIIYRANVYAEFQLVGVRLGIFHPREAGVGGVGGEDGVARNLRAPTGMALCLEVENLEEAIVHLVTLGYPPSGSIMTASHGREIYAYDPDGNWLILHEGI